ncbi:MAG: hypothetical protein L0Y74_08355 [candidate division Zixibacteria bacterium]|nr:hypothetical protein [candidate division Zixibacteria bacterium]
MFKYILLLGCLIAVALSSSLSAQTDPQGELDYLYIICGTNGSPGSGVSEVSFQIRFKGDNTGNNRVNGIRACLVATGNNIVSVDTSRQKAYAGTYFDNYNWTILNYEKLGDPDPAVPPFHVSYDAVNFGDGLTGDVSFANLTLNVNDTGVICIDTMSLDEFTFNSFVTELAVGFIPGWGGTAGNGYPDDVGICCAVEQCTAIPGDANASGNLTLADIIRTINYYFVKPNCLPDKIDCLSGLLCRGDWNGDGDATLVDIIWGINFMFDKDNPGMNCLGTDPGNCWMPVPNFPCCQPNP